MVRILKCIFVGLPTPVDSITNVETCVNDSTLSWNSVISDSVCGELSYNVTLLLNETQMVTIYTTNVNSYNFTGLSSGAGYTVFVAGRNDVGLGQSSTSTFTTPSMDASLPGKFILLVCVNYTIL